MKKACLTPRCPNYTEKGGRCPSCKYKHRLVRFAEGLTGSRPETAEWRRLRRQIRRRDKVCTQCGAGENLEVHHIDGDSRNNSRANLRLLCRRCHLAVTAARRLGPSAS